MNNMLNQSTGRVRLTKTKGFVLASLIAGAMALPFLMPVQKAQADNGDSEPGRNPHALLGTWIVQVSVDPHTVPPGSLLNFTSLETYGAGGGFVVSNNGPGAGGPPGQGNWVRTGDRQFAATLLRLGFDTAHTFTSINKIRSILTAENGAPRAPLQRKGFETVPAAERAGEKMISKGPQPHDKSGALH